VTKLRQSLHEVLCFKNEKPDRGKVRRYYAEWRRQNDLHDRCDNAECRFHTEPLTWNGAPLKPILDHINGNCHDNNTKNLHYLCPNCDSQLDTRGGANKGRVQKQTDGGYELHDKKTGRSGANVFPPGAEALALAGHPPTIDVTEDEEIE
jgi:hypothetical protein